MLFFLRPLFFSLLYTFLRPSVTSILPYIPHSMLCPFIHSYSFCLLSFLFSFLLFAPSSPPFSSTYFSFNFSFLLPFLHFLRSMTERRNQAWKDMQRDALLIDGTQLTHTHTTANKMKKNDRK